MATTSNAIGLSEFASMSKNERKQRVDALFQAAISPTYDQIEARRRRIEDEIQEYESRYKMSSGELLASLGSSEVSGIAEICSWLNLLKARDQIAKKSGCSRSK
jgi:hypothetical protein